MLFARKEIKITITIRIEKQPPKKVKYARELTSCAECV
jgi:hypothetical protein